MSLKPLRIVLAGLLCATAAHAAQDQLPINTAIDGPVLRFDWPALEIGIGSYEAGPTGLTVIRFHDRASVAVDVRGGAPGTVNTDLLRQGYGARFIDAIVFSGGSAYGEEAITGVMTGLKDDGTRSGAWENTAIAAGAVIYDFQSHRLNEIYPDKRLAQAALHDLRPGVFPLQAQGAGRMAMQGGFFGCAAHSGQGGAFRQIGETRIAAFVVVNAVGSVTDRDGRMVSCHRNPAWGEATRTTDLLARAIDTASAPAPAGPTQNTTISLVVTNRKLAPADLQRLAVQVHTSMARAIQPFSTYTDGDTLFAASTQEVGDEATRPRLAPLDAAAAEVMWDAILASVPSDPAAGPPPPAVEMPAERLAGLAGRYGFGPRAVLDVREEGGRLLVRMIGERFFDLQPQPVAVLAASPTEFYLDSRYHTRLAFTLDANGYATAATINPGRWAQHGERLP